MPHAIGGLSCRLVVVEPADRVVPQPLGRTFRLACVLGIRRGLFLVLQLHIARAVASQGDTIALHERQLYSRHVATVSEKHFLSMHT